MSSGEVVVGGPPEAPSRLHTFTYVILQFIKLSFVEDGSRITERRTTPSPRSRPGSGPVESSCRTPVRPGRCTGGLHPTTEIGRPPTV